MKNKTYSIFGAGAAGLYTAWRLLDGTPNSKNNQAKQLSKGDTLELYDWGKYDFSKEEPGTRAPLAGRIIIAVPIRIAHPTQFQVGVLLVVLIMPGTNSRARGTRAGFFL